MKKNIILATTSPHRKAAFAMLGIPFETANSNVEEYFDGRPSEPEQLVCELARLKAEAVLRSHDDDSIIIGFDSVGWFDGMILEKPRSKDEARERLRALSGKVYQFYTGIHMIDGSRIEEQKILCQAVKSDLVMRDLTIAEIDWYLEQDDQFTTRAQGFDPLGTYGASFVKEIHGSYNNPLRGIPLEVIVEMLKKVGCEI